jgi:hypothetical protein
MAAEADLILQRQHAAVILARQAAMREVKRRRQKRGLRETLPYSVLSRLAIEWLHGSSRALRRSIGFAHCARVTNYEQKAEA